MPDEELEDEEAKSKTPAERRRTKRNRERDIEHKVRVILLREKADIRRKKEGAFEYSIKDRHIFLDLVVNLKGLEILEAMMKYESRGMTEMLQELIREGAEKKRLNAYGR